MKFSEDEFIDATKDLSSWESLRSRLYHFEKSAIIAFTVIAFAAVLFLLFELIIFTESEIASQIPYVFLVFSIVPLSAVFPLRLCRLTMAAICEKLSES